MELRQLVDQHRAEVLRVQDSLSALRRDHARCVDLLLRDDSDPACHNGNGNGNGNGGGGNGWSRRTRRGREGSQGPQHLQHPHGEGSGQASLPELLEARCAQWSGRLADLERKLEIAANGAARNHQDGRGGDAERKAVIAAVKAAASDIRGSGSATTVRSANAARIFEVLDAALRGDDASDGVALGAVEGLAEAVREMAGLPTSGWKGIAARSHPSQTRSAQLAKRVEELEAREAQAVALASRIAGDMPAGTNVVEAMGAVLANVASGSTPAFMHDAGADSNSADASVSAGGASSSSPSSQQHSTPVAVLRAKLAAADQLVARYRDDAAACHELMEVASSGAAPSVDPDQSTHPLAHRLAKTVRAWCDAEARQRRDALIALATRQQQKNGHGHGINAGAGPGDGAGVAGGDGGGGSGGDTHHHHGSSSFDAEDYARSRALVGSLLKRDTSGVGPLHAELRDLLRLIDGEDAGVAGEYEEAVQRLRREGFGREIAASGSAPGSPAAGVGAKPLLGAVDALARAYAAAREEYDRCVGFLDAQFQGPVASAGGGGQQGQNGHGPQPLLHQLKVLAEEYSSNIDSYHAIAHQYTLAAGELEASERDTDTLRKALGTAEAARSKSADDARRALEAMETACAMLRAASEADPVSLPEPVPLPPLTGNPADDLLPLLRMRLYEDGPHPRLDRSLLQERVMQLESALGVAHGMVIDPTGAGAGGAGAGGVQSVGSPMAHDLTAGAGASTPAGRTPGPIDGLSPVSADGSTPGRGNNSTLNASDTGASINGNSAGQQQQQQQQQGSSRGIDRKSPFVRRAPRANLQTDRQMPGSWVNVVAGADQAGQQNRRQAAKAAKAAKEKSEGAAEIAALLGRSTSNTTTGGNTKSREKKKPPVPVKAGKSSSSPSLQSIASPLAQQGSSSQRGTPTSVVRSTSKGKSGGSSRNAASVSTTRPTTGGESNTGKDKSGTMPGHHDVGTPSSAVVDGDHHPDDATNQSSSAQSSLTELPHPTPVLRSRRIEDLYTIGDILGTGSFAVVRLCRSRTTGKEYAVKIVDKTKWMKYLDCIQREVDILMDLNHPNVIRLHEVIDNPNTLYMVTDLCTGGDLLEYIERNGPLTEAQARCVISSTLVALEYLHGMGVVHRDLKPENILLGPGGPCDPAGVKLCDFGHSAYLPEMAPPGAMRTATSSEAFGTFIYLAPEVVLTRQFSRPMDLWSLGVVLYIALAGAFPFDGSTDEELFDEIVAGKIDCTGEAWTHISRGGVEFLKGLMNTDPEGRPTASRAKTLPWVQEAVFLDPRAIRAGAAGAQHHPQIGGGGMHHHQPHMPPPSSMAGQQPQAQQGAYGQQMQQQHQQQYYQQGQQSSSSSTTTMQPTGTTAASAATASSATQQQTHQGHQASYATQVPYGHPQQHMMMGGWAPPGVMQHMTTGKAQPGLTHAQAVRGQAQGGWGGPPPPGMRWG